jgi:hypothetical protein
MSSLKTLLVYNLLTINKLNMKIYIVDESHTDDCPSMYTDEQFKEAAESQGFVYTLSGFQNQWNATKLDVDQDYHWMRIL